MAMRPSTRMQLGKMAREQNRQPGRKMEIEYETWGEPEQRYGREPRSNWRESPRMGGYGPENREGRMDYDGPRSTWNEDMEMRRGRRGGARSDMETEMRRGGGTRSDMEIQDGYGAESRFRDRRGREHYDNGRFAPMAGGYGPYSGDYDGPFGREERGGEDMRPIGFVSRWDDQPRMNSDASMPRYNEMERLPGNRPMMGGYMSGERDYPKLDEQTAMRWARNMRNEDGSKAPHWTMDQIKQVMAQKSVDCELPEFFAIMNALYADYDPILKKYNASTIDFYVDMAKAWLKDKDAVPNKAMAYYECIVKK